MLQSRSSDSRPLGGCVLATRRFSRQEPGPAGLVASAVAANFPHVVVVVLRLPSVSPFTTPRFQDAATPVLLLSSKKRRPRQPSLHRRIVIVQKDTFSPEAYMFDLPTIGRRRTSPVMTQDHFLQAAACITPNGSPAITAWLPERRSSESTPSASRRGGVWHTMKAEMPSPGVSLPGPFDTLPSPVLPVETPWLRTSVESCGVRAESSERARTRSGRLWHVSPPLGTSPFVHGANSVLDLVLNHCGSRARTGVLGAFFGSFWVYRGFSRIRRVADRRKKFL